MSVLRFGKLPPKIDYRTLRFGDYLTEALPPPPPTFDVLPRVFAGVPGGAVADLFPMDGNDSLSDCTIAAAAHATTIFNAFLDRRSVMALADVTKVFFHLSGGVNTGLSELDVLNYWQSTGIAGENLLAFASIQPGSLDHIKQAVSLFGGVYIGFRVQQGCDDDFNNGRPWTPAPLTMEGHAVFVTGYDGDGVSVLTWGGLQKGTWAWWAECVDEAYAVLPPEANDPTFAPGFDIDQLKTDLNAVAN